MIAYLKSQNYIGEHIDLYPLNESLIDPLIDTLYHPETFFVKERGYNTKEKIKQVFLDRLAEQEKMNSLTLVAKLKQNGDFCAMSSYLFPSPTGHKIEIGFSWVAQQCKQTFVNSEMKLLMLEAAFSYTKTKRVEFCVDPANHMSQKAMRGIGAVYEGTLRNFRFNSDTDLGDRCLFSITDSDWPRVKSILQTRLARKSPVASKRPAYIGHFRDFFESDKAYYPGSTELFSIGAPLGKKLGLQNLGIHVEMLPPGRRTSWPHAESTEEEFVFILEGTPIVWLDGVTHQLYPGEFIAFPAGTKIAHTFINRSQKSALLLVGGEKKPDTNKVFYPLHPARNKEISEKGYLWKLEDYKLLGDDPGV